MSHEIDLSKYKVHTYLAIDLVENNEIKGVKSNTIQYDDIIVTSVKVDEFGSKKIGKKLGNYITIEFEDISDYTNRENVKKIFIQEMKNMLNIMHINEDDEVLIMGLGNAASTPDALGPKAVNNVVVTKHLFMLGDVEEGFRSVSALAPGVMGQTGIETSDIIKSIIKTIKPKLIIVIDSLASQAISRVNKTIQMTDTGINPGSGIGNTRKEISYETLNIPVLAIGVPTVVDAVTIVSDTINYLYKNYSYTKENMDNPVNKLMMPGSVNYLKKDVKVDIEDKKKLFGIVGDLSDMEIKQLMSEVLTPIGYNLMVTPKEVDFVIDNLADVIGNGINNTLHKRIDNM